MLYWYRYIQIVLIVSVIPGVCHGETNLTGPVEDPTGAIVPSARITLINKQTADAQSTRADEEGALYSLVNEIAKAQAENRPQASYQMVRKYRIFPSNNTNSASEIVAAVDFQPPTTKRYTIQKTSGSRRAEQVVRSILDHEVEASAQGRQIPTAAVIQDSYEVAYLGDTIREGHPCYLLGLSPKRKDKNLIAGKAWVDKRTYLIREINGDLVKTPSWWLKNVHLKMTFDYVEGTWLQTSTEAEADVRVFGNQTLTAEIVEFRPTDVAAKTQPPARVHAQ